MMENKYVNAQNINIDITEQGMLIVDFVDWMKGETYTITFSERNTDVFRHFLMDNQ